MKTPNILTVIRVFMIPIFIGAFLMEGIDDLVTGAIFLIAALTDALDGHMLGGRSRFLLRLVRVLFLHLSLSSSWLFLFCNSQFGATRAWVSGYFLVGGYDDLIVHQTERCLYVAEEILFGLALDVARLHDVLHHPVFQ